MHSHNQQVQPQIPAPVLQNQAQIVRHQPFVGSHQQTNQQSLVSTQQPIQVGHVNQPAVQPQVLPHNMIRSNNQSTGYQNFIQNRQTPTMPNQRPIHFNHASHRPNNPVPIQNMQQGAMFYYPYNPLYSYVIFIFLFYFLLLIFIFI